MREGNTPALDRSRVTPPRSQFESQQDDSVQEYEDTISSNEISLTSDSAGGSNGSQLSTSDSSLDLVFDPQISELEKLVRQIAEQHKRIDALSRQISETRASNQALETKRQQL